MRRRAALLRLVPLVFVVFVAAPALASCAPPSLTLDPSGARAGEMVTVLGHAWSSECPDSCTGSCTGSSSCAAPPPLRGIVVTVDGQLVGSADSDGDRFELRFRVPDLPPGRYEVEARDGDVVAETFLLVTD